ncbi:MAG: peptidoglycan DD-metalloendopeptidase family protein [Prevotellaceae bacterium]|nr:peptidoglycan DD-metalloendopeptidase family protein [Prevotellaceae bacterium]
MRRIVLILFALLIITPSFAQKKKTTTQKKAKTTRVKKKSKSKKSAKTADYSNASIKGLRNQRENVQRKIKEQEKLLRANKADVKKRLNNLMTLNSEINQHQKSLDDIQKDITHIEGNIDLLKNQLATLEQQLQERKSRYIKSMRYMARNRTIQDQLMFIFSAKNFAQMYRRMRFVREYAAYQRTQGEMVKAKQSQIAAKHKQLEEVKGQKHSLLNKGKQEQTALQDKQAKQQEVVNTLKKQQKTIQSVIADQRKKDAALNDQIDRLVAEEVAKARARAEEEARKKAAAAAAEAKRKAEELARKKAAAEAAAKENARRIAEAKEREEKLKAQARAAEKKSAAERAAAEQAAREAEAKRVAAERKAEVDEKRHKREVDVAQRSVSESTSLDTQDRKLSGNFERNRGSLPMPITGSYKIVSHFGQYNVEGLKNVTLDNKGINILGSSGAQARSIFEGEVSAVFGYGDTMVVMVRHGNYISVYCNLRSVSVRKGQHVNTRQAIGVVGSDNILQFQLRKGSAKLNPESWLRR